MSIRYSGLFKQIGGLKKVLTINPGILVEKFKIESEQEAELQRIDAIDYAEIAAKNKGDSNLEHWDDVQEKVEDAGEDEEKEKAVVTIEAERLPRVPKPFGDVFQDLMKLDIGILNVESITTLD